MVHTITYTGSLAGNISYVGFGTNDAAAASRDYIVDNFSLTSVPEPEESALVGALVSLLALLWFSFRRS